MKNIRFLFFILLLWGQFIGFGQNFSNKGKDFWLGYGYHVNMAGNPVGGGTQDMILYFTSDKNANVTVEMPANGYKQTYSLIANQVTVSSPIPKTGVQDARLYDTGFYNKGIHVYSDVDIVAYAHIYNGSVSGASLLFPTNTLGKDYYVIDYNQSSNANNANSFAFVVAVENNTTVEITPSVANKNNRGTLPFTISLNQGQVYNLMGTTTGNQGTDLTGTRIRTISAGGSCKKIAVFCGAGKMSIGGNAGGTADNLFAQAMPASAWGLKYLTSPTTSQPSNYFRICVTDSTTKVRVNGNLLPFSYLQRSFFYELKNSTPLTTPGNGQSVPNITGGVWNLIEADKPINVAQFCTTVGQDGNTGAYGDPEMIYLSPVEQTINDITLYSASKAAIQNSFINVIIKKGGTQSFTLDGVSKASSFMAHPQDANYSYASFPVSVGASHHLYSDTGYNAIAYGFGPTESYGYNAGTNIRDFTPVATFQNVYNRIDSAVTCVNSPLKFSIPLSYVPSTIKWDFSAAPGISPNTIIGPNSSPSYDSVGAVNGLYYYSPNKTFKFSSPNTLASRDTIKLYTTSATPDGCGSTDQLYTIPVIVRGTPIAAFSIIHAGCVSDAAQLTNQSNGNGNSLSRWIWNFGDGSSADLTNGNPFGKLYTSAGTGSYAIKLKVVSDIGCISDSVVKTLNLSTKPVAGFTKPAITCVNDTVTFTDASTIQVGTLAKWTWDLDNGAGQVTNTSNISQSSKYTSFGAKDVRLLVESSTGCKSDTFRISPQFKINPLPQVGFILPEVCVSDGSAIFTDTTKIADGSAASKWNWTIFPGKNTGAQPVFIDATVQNAKLIITKADYYPTLLKVTSQNGCIDSLFQQFTVNGPTPKADFTVQNNTALCSNDSIRIVNTSTVDFGYLTRLDIVWDLINDSTKKTPDETPFDKKSYSHIYPNFQNPATLSYSVKLNAFSGNSSVCQNSITKIVTINRSPKVSFVKPRDMCNDASPRLIIPQASTVTSVPGTPTYMGKGITNPITGMFDPSISGNGAFAIKYLHVSDMGCRDSVLQQLSVWPSPVAKWSVSAPDCEKNAITFADSSQPKFSNIARRIWNFGDNTTQTLNTAGNFTHTYASAKSYDASLQIITDSGCVSAINTQAIKVNYLPKIDFSLPSVCLPDGNSQFINQSTIGDGSDALFSYLWNFNDPNDPSAATTKSPNHRYSALGPYTIQLKITTRDGCIDSLTKLFTTIYPQPKADFTISSANICLGDTIQFFDKSNGITLPANTWNWDLSGGTISALQNPIKKFNDSGTFNITLYIYNGKGCVSDTVTKQVIVNPYPKLKLGPDIHVLEGGQVKIKPFFYYGISLSYLWTPSMYLDSTNVLTPTTTPLDDITYTLLLTGKGGCSVSDTIFIKVLKSPDVPNVFSPNGDGINDTWHIKYLDSYPGAEVEVYNRYGQLVFREVGYDTEWDGTYKGSSLPIGTYYYIINPKNGRQIVKGSVTIIK